MKFPRFLAIAATVSALGCTSLHAQAQPLMTFTKGTGSTWDADWDGVSGRTYFLQYSLDLVNWSHAPTMRFGTGTHGIGIDTLNEVRFFVRLKYVDDGSVTTLAEAEAADFDGDGLSNLLEIQSLGANPFSLDSDGDGMPDAYEYSKGFNLAVDDSALDADSDGATNLAEYTAGTNPLYYDTDGDGFYDGIELATAGLDPLVANTPGDADGDGIGDLEELAAGTSHVLADTDGDGVNDNIEIQNGSDPTDPGSTPFDATLLFGQNITDTDIQPIGDLGVSGYAHGELYNVNFTVNDPTSWAEDPGDPGTFIYTKNQEQWSLRVGNHARVDTVIPPTPSGHQGSGQIYLNPSEIHEVSLQHLGVAGLADDGSGAAPDYQHSWNLISKDFIPVSSIAGNAITFGYNPNFEPSNRFFKSFAKSDNPANPVFPTGYDWTNHTTYLIPIATSSYSASYTGSDATGPRFRKISLSGRPIPDEKPEGESETDEAMEDSYIDAFDLSLRHDTSFASIPLASSDLRLEANASVSETTWSNRSGLRPDEDLTLPFGIGWTSNLCAYIQTTETYGSATTRPTTLTVVDETGRPQRFGTKDNMATFFAWPSSLTDKKTYLSKLYWDGSNLILEKKYGNKLTYSPCDSWFMYPGDRLDGSPSVTKHRYWRLAEVEDRFGSKVTYNYGANAYSLIPAEISAVGRADQKLTIVRSTDGRRVLSVTDAEGDQTVFTYNFDQTYTIPTTSFSYNYDRLQKVTFPGGDEEHYTYEVIHDKETAFQKVTYHLHANVKSIKRDDLEERVFTYGFNRTRKWHSYALGRVAITANTATLPSEVETRAQDYVAAINSGNQPGILFLTQYGLPRLVTSVSVPTMSIQASFSKTAGSEIKFGPEFSATTGTDVTDAEGKKYTYTFGGTQGEIVDKTLSATGNSSSLSNEWLIYHTTTTLEYKDPGGTVLGSETFEFDPASGLSLDRTVDFSGNETNWEFITPNGEPLPTDSATLLTLGSNPAFYSEWADPSKKTDELGRIEAYEYGTYRMMTKHTDVHGTITEYVVDAMGRRTKMTVTDPVNGKILEEDYEYTNATFPAFMTKKTRKAFANPTGKTWEVDLVVDYVADSRGRLWKEIVDPAGEALETVHTYDLNNRKLTTTDPKLFVTQFKYDETGTNPGTLDQVTYQDASFKTITYNGGHLKLSETDENDNTTLYERDGLGRIIKSARDMDDGGTITAGDLVTEFGYNDVSLLVYQIDPRGYATVTFYDDLHRPQHVFSGVPAASVPTVFDATALGTLQTLASGSREVAYVSFSYDTLKNTGGGLMVAFQPTGVTRHNAVSMDRAQPDASLSDSTTFDGVYRPVSTSSEYAPGQSRTTLVNYGTVDGNGHEPLITTVTDALGKVTQTTRDGLGRETQVIDAFGDSDPNMVLTTTMHYTSTGLLWRTIDPLTRYTETEYDSVGRAVKVFQPDPATGAITANSPVTESQYDANSNVIAIIDPLTRQTDFDFDNRNRNWRTRQPAVTDNKDPDNPVAGVRPTTTSTFDGVGNVTSVQDARGSTTRMFYDKANRVTATRTNPVTGNPSAVEGTPGTNDITTSTVYDAGGLVLSVEDGNGNFTRNAYDAMGRLIGSACDPSDGDPVALAQTGFDAAAYRSANPTCQLVSNIVDDSGNVIEVTDGEGHQTAFTFDGFSRKTSTIWDPGKTAERTETFEFNALVQTSRVDGKLRRTNYAYDSLHRMTDVIHDADSSGTGHVENRLIAYDKASRVTSVTYPNDSGSIKDVSTQYDFLDRITQETSAGVTHTYPSYDKVGNRLTTTYGRTGTTLISTYDALNRLETCEERTTAGTPSGRTTFYKYDLGGLVTRKTLPNGNRTDTDRDYLGRTLYIEERTSTLNLISSFDYSQAVAPWPTSHDGVGNVLRCAEDHTMSGVTDRVVVNTYDHCNRLDTEAITPSGGSTTTTDYDYDLADNRVSKSDGTTTTDYVFGNGNNGANSNQLISYGPSGQTATHNFTYDNNGNRLTKTTSAGTEDYTWDEVNRLVLLETPSGDYAYAYDHRTRRVVRDESLASGALTELTFSGGTSVQEANSSGTVQVELIRGSDWGGGVGGVLFTISGGNRSYNAYNSRGDVVSVTGDDGLADWQAAYEAFGTRTQEDGTNTERQRANTKDEDPTGLLNEGFRYRDLEAGVFISRDPLGFIDGANVYAYVSNNPWTLFDPLGLSETWPWKWKETGFWGKVGTVVSSPVHALFDVGAVPSEAFLGLADSFNDGIENNKAFANDEIDEFAWQQNRHAGLKGVAKDSATLAQSMPGTSITGPVDYPGVAAYSQKLARTPITTNPISQGRISRLAQTAEKTVGDNGYMTLRFGNGAEMSARLLSEDHLYISMVKVPEAHRGSGYGSALYKRILQEHPEVTRVSGVPGMDNARVLQETGDIAQTPRAKALAKEGFTEHEHVDGIMISKKPKAN